MCNKSYEGNIQIVQAVLRLPEKWFKKGAVFRTL